MKYYYLLSLIILCAMPEKLTVFDFQADKDLSNWMVVDDVVMGGRSDGNCYLNAAGNAVFEGLVSLENNGGFSSVRCSFERTSVADYTKAVIRLKGDGKRYQFRVKSSRRDWQSYITYFETTGDWQTIEIPLADLYPTFRGMRLDMPNYDGQQMSQISFLIANKKAESFRLELESLRLE